MIQASPTSHSTVGSLLRTLLVFDAIALLFAGIVHLVGGRIALGTAVFDEPILLPAGIVEGLAGLVFVAAIYAAFLRRSWAWPIALAAHLFAIAGFLLGLWATRDGTAPFNAVYHRVMLAVFVAGLILLLTRPGREVLGQTPGQ